ncbi:sporulation sigma-E factor-processing peptidase [Clostridia bacterium]|nr:sporulation sigma-E factor-processing peptidase [Clostridia bacterium]
MSVVYIDEVFLLNLTLNYLLLLLSARLAGIPFKRRRLGLGALLGAGYAVLAAIPGFGWVGMPWIRAAASVPIALIAVGRGRYFWRGLLLFWVSSFVLAGAVTALGLRNISITPLIVTAAAAYLILTLTLKGFARYGASGKGAKIVQVTASVAERAVTFDALVDTGHALTDPMTGQSVLVADLACVSPLLPPEVRRLIDENALSKPVELLARISEPKLRLIPYQTIGGRGMLLAFRPDKLTVNGSGNGSLIAISPMPMSAKNPYAALIGG